MKAQNLQFKLSLNEGLANIWSYLTQEYEGLDKASIIRLALTTLAKTTKRQQSALPADILGVLADMKKNEKGISEDEFFTWWNKNKSTL
ncbi:hypothetical protein BH09PAT1_BH09PAT1_1710 [soil metagenome]